MTVQVDPPAEPAPKAWVRRRDDLGEHVAKRIGALQTRLLWDMPQPEAVSALARLRRGLGRTPGFDFTLERYLQVPDHLLGYRPADDAEASDAEQAVHDAVTLYALHQQSRRARMHVEGRGLGRALGDLVRASGGPEGYVAGSRRSALPVPTRRASTTCEA